MAPDSRPSDRPRPEGGSRSGAGRGRGPAPSKGRGPNRPGPGRGPRDDEREDRAPRTWGSLARKGARRLDDDPRDAGTARPDGPAPQRSAPDTWVDEGPVRGAAKGAVRRGGAGARSARPGSPSEVDLGGAEVEKAVGAKDAARYETRLKDAARAYERERYPEARKLLGPLADRMPANAAVRELLGLTHYRTGRWKPAIAELEAFRELSGSTEQHPVLADCYRALRRWDEVEALWEELREVSPSAELVTEGRIVFAGSLADRDRLSDAISLLEKGFKFPKNPQAHHLRRAYALADLYERVGDLPRARSLFERVASLDPEFGDVEDRVRSLR